MADKKFSDAEEKTLLYLYKSKDSGREMTFEEIVAGTGLAARVVRSAIRSLTESGHIGGKGPDLLRDATKMMVEMQPDFPPTSRGYTENIILIASVIARADEAFLAEELSYDPEFVALVGSRLRTAGIWKDAAVSELHLNKWTEDSVAFFLDCAVAVGDLMIVGENANRELLYQMTPGGKGHVENLLGR